MSRIVIFLMASLLFTYSASSGAQGLAWITKLETNAHVLKYQNEQECLDNDGIWIDIDPEYPAECVSRIVDSGKACFDHYECQAFCITTKNVEEGRSVEGVCASDYYQPGCLQGVSQGKAEHILCRCG